MKILLVEDEFQISEFIKKGLSERNYEVVVASDGKTGLDLATSDTYNLIILDLMLPKMNGIEVCKHIRMTNYEVPILMLTALDTTDDKVKGLNAGADDYLPKPFDFGELEARVKALIRRSTLGASAPVETEHRKLAAADLVCDLDNKQVTRDSKEIQLTAKEFALLELFLRNKNKVLDRATIAEKIWGLTFDSGTNIVDVYVNYLRKKVDKEFDTKLIHTRVGFGYILKDEEAASA
ncbi:response regulator transcription factor [Persicobacter psychrovividus]|uniref:DNA-binding response regulator n=1 Tax=Persicobacter psychrovividus TaxID=387638 RepID=A0ABN6LF29_9BACT|nr:DNA-binding response regulator [Persicobacter psychrovividus]